MMYEVKARYTEGDKTVKVHYLLDAELFGEAEAKAYEKLQDHMDVDVVSIRRSAIREVIRTDNLRSYYCATIATVFVDSEKEKTIKYKILLPAATIEEAQKAVSEFLQQGYDMRLDAIKLTTINAVL